jgi:outer membrane protein TolC
MKKIIMISLGLSLTAFGMSYQAFKNYTKSHAKVLQSQALSLQTRQEESKILLRTANPILGLEASHFNPKSTDTSFQYSASISQSIRSNGYYAGLEDKALAQNLLQEAYIREGKAGYIKGLELLYTEYVYQSKLKFLLEKEYRLSTEVTHIVEERYKSGSETKVAYLQAKTDTLALKTEIFASKQAMNRLYYQLLALSGMKKKVSLEKKFIYAITAHTHRKEYENSQKAILKAKSKVLESQMRMNENTIERYDVYTAIDDEPDQAIIRMGVSMPLPIFNNKSEEKMLAKLQNAQLDLDKEQLDLDIFTQKAMIKSSLKALFEQYQALKILKKDQKDLNDLLQEGYKIAQGSIFMMMNAKNKLIQTQKSLLDTEKMINTQKIQLYFVEGHYND